MGFVGAASSTSSLLHSPLLYPFLFPSSSSSSCRPHRTTKQLRSPVVVCCSRHQQDPICNKRTFLLMGVAVLPFLKFNTAVAAVEGILSSPSTFVCFFHFNVLQITLLLLFYFLFMDQLNRFHYYYYDIILFWVRGYMTVLEYVVGLNTISQVMTACSYKHLLRSSLIQRETL